MTSRSRTSRTAMASQQDQALAAGRGAAAAPRGQRRQRFPASQSDDGHHGVGSAPPIKSPGDPGILPWFYHETCWISMISMISSLGIGWNWVWPSRLAEKDHENWRSWPSKWVFLPWNLLDLPMDDWRMWQVGIKAEVRIDGWNTLCIWLHLIAVSLRCEYLASRWCCSFRGIQIMAGLYQFTNTIMYKYIYIIYSCYYSILLIYL